MISVNLIPPELKQEIEIAKRNRATLNLLYKIIFMIIITCAVFAFFFFYFKHELNEQKAIYAAREKSIHKFGTLEENAKKVADRLETIKTITGGSSIWYPLLLEINRVVPSGVYLKSLKADNNLKNRSQISGYALSKNDVATFRDALEKSTSFQYVDIESSTTQNDPITKKELESFSITLSLEPGALK